jgi:hypothetical protein
LDEGDLGPVEDLLKSMGIDVLRRSGGEAGRPTLLPTQLLITSGNITFAMPTLEVEAGLPEPTPMWICIHNQDFLPLRPLLREAGVQYLVRPTLDRGSLRRFLAQLLYQGPERRREMRLALGGRVRLRAGRRGAHATLVDLTADACALRVNEPILPGTPTCALLPASLGGGEELALEGSVARCQPEDGAHVVVLNLENSSDDALRRLRALTDGEQIGSRVTPLATTASSAPAPAPNGADRRASTRRAYDVPVRPVGTGRDWGLDLTLGRDLSTTGVRILGGDGLAPGMTLRLALYGGDSDAPFVLDARVIRNEGPAGTALAFEALTPETHDRLARLCESLPEIDSLEGEEASAGRVVVSKVLTRSAP